MNNILKTLAAVIITVVTLKVVFAVLGIAGWFLSNIIGLAILGAIIFVAYQFILGFTSRMRAAR